MDAQPYPKRARTESDPSATTFTRSKIWYYDGSVVLQAEQTQFRVHSSLLSAGSTVFKDMFEVARAPSDVDSQVEGCPVVQLFGDKAQDVELVLDALYDRNFYKVPKKGFGQVAAMWRLGKKYGFEELRDDAARRLQHLYPSSLKDFQSCWYINNGSAISSYIRFYPGMTFDIINLARETGFVSILPAALYIASSLAQEHRAIQSSIMKSQLSDADKTLCILATADLLHKQWELPYGWLAVSQAKCVNHDCRNARELVKAALGYPITSLVALKPEVPELGRYVCMNCVARRDVRFKYGQEALWAQLPDIFGLPSWDEIAKEMNRMMQPATAS